MLIYLIKVNVSLIVFYLCYKLFFQRDTFWTFRRIYLLISILFSILYPLISVEGWIKKQEPIISAISSIQLNEFVFSPNGLGQTDFFTLENVLWVLYGSVALFLFWQTCIQLFSILSRRMKGSKEILKGVEIIRMDEKITPFSFFKWIFINPALHAQYEMEEILEHEKTHVRQWHSLDVIMGRLQSIVCWFNPAVWLIQHEIRNNLEFLADNQVIKSGYEPKKYQYHLLSLAYEPADSKLGNQFNVSPLKKRIRMMNSKRTKKAGLFKYGIIIPITLSILALSGMQEVLASMQNTTEIAPPTKQKKVAESTNKKGVDFISLQKIDKNQTTTPNSDPEKSAVVEDGVKVYEIVDVPPEFPGGESTMYEFLANNIQYPEEAQKEQVEGRVTVQFIVNTDGKAISPKIVRGINPLLDAEAIRVINSMPQWTPGKLKGKVASVRYTLPIAFKIPKDEYKAEKQEMRIPEGILIILDGEAVSNDKMNQIAPNDIESISVLKDKSATELYGEKGKKGVIVITTKK